MKLSILTINYNNAEGLRRTLASVAAQTYRNIEHIIVDGASTDGSVDVLKEYEKQNSLLSRVKSSTRSDCQWSSVEQTGVGSHSIIWTSEPDNGIYNAINKGILKATGDYVQVLNSGDLLAAPDVTECMVSALDSLNAQRSTLNEDVVDILYGNMLKENFEAGKILGKSGEVEYSLRQYYSGTLNHDCCYIRRDLFEQYGLYDESLKIVSDWKWFLQVIGLGNVKPVYVDIDVTIFDAGGISEKNLSLRNQERRQVLEKVLPPPVLADYDKYAFPMRQYDRLKRHHLWILVYFIERVIFKLEKWHVLK